MPNFCPTHPTPCNLQYLHKRHVSHFSFSLSHKIQSNPNPSLNSTPHHTSPPASKSIPQPLLKMHTATLPLLLTVLLPFTKAWTCYPAATTSQTLAVCCGQYYDYTPPSTTNLKFAIMCGLATDTDGDYSCPADTGAIGGGCCRTVSFFLSFFSLVTPFVFSIIFYFLLGFSYSFLCE